MAHPEPPQSPFPPPTLTPTLTLTVTLTLPSPDLASARPARPPEEPCPSTAPIDRVPSVPRWTRWFLQSLSLALGLTLLLQTTGCTTSTASTTSSSRTKPAPAPAPYTRVASPDSNTFSLQIALRKFVPRSGRGPALWLSGVSHIGETNYYAGLQRHLDTQTVEIGRAHV